MTKFWLALICLLMSATAAAASGAVSDGQKANRLLNVPSPYLRQHAHNPVNWYPWGKEAFAKAVAENKPIFLSVGYSACHWCHVMERESFTDQKIADLINENFIAVKVDRERRPDIDETYILATQIATGGSGWPNNVFLTPDLKPFVGGTYFPPEDFTHLLTEVALRWTTDQKLLRQEGNRIAGLIDRIMSHRVAAADVTAQALKGAAASSLATFDPIYGGIGTANKFPRENLLLFLLDRAEKYDDKAALKAATGTLDAMIHGGIQDQIGGGFHRYTVDRQWRVPHFEKMLYNQAQAGRALVQAYRITGKRRYKDTARALFDFVLRDMTSPKGGFYSAFDADSLSASGQSEEGLYYLWDENSIEAALNASDVAFAKRVFGISFEGNFDGRTILHLPKSLRQVATAENMTIGALTIKLDAIKKRLRQVRSKRKAPYLDEKMLTSWNGLMIKALAEAAVTFDEPRYTSAAVRAATLFWRDVGAKQAKLKRYYYKGTASLDATQPDHALLALGFVALYDATQNQDWLNRAKLLADAMNAAFLDKDVGDYFMTAAGSGFYRPKISTDGDVPSGNASALELFAKLSRRQLDLDYRSKGEALLSAISGAALQQPDGYSYALRSADELLRGETGSLKFIAKGRVRAMARLANDRKSIVISAIIAKGWHINAHKPLEDLFIPTDVKLGSAKTGKPDEGVQNVSYPAPILRKLGFNDKELAVYEGKVTIVAQTGANGDIPKTIAFTAQTCSDKICLEPETVSLSVLQ